MFQSTKHLEISFHLNQFHSTNIWNLSFFHKVFLLFVSQNPGSIVESTSVKGDSQGQPAKPTDQQATEVTQMVRVTAWGHSGQNTIALRWRKAVDRKGKDLNK